MHAQKTLSKGWVKAFLREAKQFLHGNTISTHSAMRGNILGARSMKVDPRQYAPITAFSLVVIDNYYLNLTGKQ